MHDIQTPFGEPSYLVLAGSRLVGIDGPDSDYDYVGALVEPKEYRLGLLTYTQNKFHQRGFEQHEFKGENYEGSVYSLWKLVSMFADCNPTILSLLFADPIRDDHGINTDEFRNLVVSKKAGHRFMKYMGAQSKSMLRERARHVTRQTLINRHGYDTKFAGHTIRLGYQGIEYLTTGAITLPMPDESLTAGSRLNIRDIRAGKWTLDEVLLEAKALEKRLEVAYETSTLPDEPDYEKLSRWLVTRYYKAWANRILR